MNETARTRAIALIVELADQFGLRGRISPGLPADSTGVASRRLITAKAWQRASRVRREFFEGGGDLFADPAWEILIELYIEQAGKRRVMVSNACIAAQVPTTTGLRWLDRLFRTGLITRKHDGSTGGSYTSRYRKAASREWRWRSTPPSKAIGSSAWAAFS
jgi:hypothetical protein